MLPYYFKCRESTESKNPKAVKTIKGRKMKPDENKQDEAFFQHDMA